MKSAHRPAPDQIALQKEAWLGPGSLPRSIQPCSNPVCVHSQCSILLEPTLTDMMDQIAVAPRDVVSTVLEHTSDSSLEPRRPH